MPPFDAPFKYLEAETYTTHDIFTTVLEGVLYDPGNGIVLTQSRKILAESLYPHMDLITIYGAFFNKPFLRRKFFGKPAEVISGYSSIYQGLPNGYYHKLIDLTPRCYLLNQPEYADLNEIKLLYAEPLAEAEKVLIPKLVPANVHLTRLVPGELYYLEKLILPTFMTQFGSGYLPKPYVEKLRQEVFPQRPSKRQHRIYISRAKSASGLKKRHILNEDELLSALNRFGFEKFQLEDYSLEEKIEIFYDAETVVGAYGGGLTHILFSDKVNVLELQVMAKMQTYYYYLAKSLGHNFNFICADKSNNRENFSVDTSAVIRVLEESCC
jgi:capsular polysaccharide biosynthesis protein